MNIGEAFLQDAEESQLNGSRHAANYVRGFKCDVYSTALRESVHQPVSGGGEA